MQALAPLIKPLFSRFEWQDSRLTFWGRRDERGSRSGRYIFDLRSRAYRRKQAEDYFKGGYA